MNNRELWQNALVQIQLALPESSFRTWFRGTEIVRRDPSGDVQIGVSSKIVKDWLRDKHHKLILKALRTVDEQIRSIDYVVHKGTRPIPTPNGTITNLAQQSQKKTTFTPSPLQSIPLADTYVDKRDNLNPRYTFESFVVGPFNQLAHAATQAVISNPGLMYNPLFIYGRTGYGKTHLIQSVGNFLKKSATHKKVIYITAERFVLDYTNSIRTGRANNFKEYYRQYDVLIMDDIQFIAGKEKTQEEMFHLFNYFKDNNKQCVFSSDIHPSHMNDLEERLKTRFSGGMIAEIIEPDTESKMVIVQNKLRHFGIDVDEHLLTMITQQVSGSIRELEGVVNMLVCKTQLKGKPLDESDVRSLIKNTVKAQKGFSFDDVVKRVCRFYDLDERMIYEKTRRKEVVKPRQVLMYVLREEFGASFPMIGEKLGGRDHTTVIHSCEKIKNELLKDTQLEQEINQIRTILAN